MVGFDYVILAMIVLSALISLFRGFVREFIALATWAAAVFVCTQYSQVLAELVPDSVTQSITVKTIIAIAGLFFLTLIAGYMLTFLVQKIIKNVQLSLSDRLLGAVFGVCRGAVLAVLCIALAGYTTLPKENWWSRSEMVNLFSPMATQALLYLPESLRQSNWLIAPQPQSGT